MRISDWSSDVCSSDLPVRHLCEAEHGRDAKCVQQRSLDPDAVLGHQQEDRPVVQVGPVGARSQPPERRGRQRRGQRARRLDRPQGEAGGEGVGQEPAAVEAGVGLVDDRPREDQGGERGGPDQPSNERRWSAGPRVQGDGERSEEHTSELQSLMRISYAVFCLKKKKEHTTVYSMTASYTTM